MEQIATNAVLAEDDPMENASANQDQKKAVAQAEDAAAANAVALVNAPQNHVAIPVLVVPIKCA